MGFLAAETASQVKDHALEDKMANYPMRFKAVN